MARQARLSFPPPPLWNYVLREVRGGGGVEWAVGALDDGGGGDLLGLDPLERLLVETAAGLG